ncbi:rasGAP-activating-like protein 1 [Trichosurus vulpecula]|uniref:rasGAP-activating-like protein 1 n=1 Tax=Trichosurus vulpecula TaxID=9337 RepID=UPI00186B0AC3|nr:rasGAP-activating-like protein 1 [Trichosurus vulpecula]
MARNISLNFRVVEGRDLPAKDVSGNSDPYCIVKVDHEVVARTATVWRNLNPFWGEEFTLHLPLDFHHLAFYVLDEDTIGHDDIIGKISLSKETIAAASPRGIDSWLNLSHVDPDEEVQGEIHLDVKLWTEAQGPRLRCHIIEARDLAPRDLSGTSDPFARIFWGSQSLDTVTIKKTRFPHWDEVLELHGEEGPLRVEVWDWDMVGKNDFLGMVEFPPDVLLQCPPSGWFRLLPFASAEEDAGGKLGALRLKVRLAEERILPSVYYQPLIDLLVESVLSPAQDDTVTPLAMLDEVSSGESRQDIATQLVKIFLGRGLAVPLLDYLNLREVSRTNEETKADRSGLAVVGRTHLRQDLDLGVLGYKSSSHVTQGFSKLAWCEQSVGAGPGQVRTSIPVCRICAVERVDENAFQQPHMMQVITKNRDGQLDTMYIQCKNVNELNQWLSAIRKASVCNEGMLPSCHPGAFRGNRWTCCLQQDRTVQGCSRTHSAVTLGDWSDPLDPDTEAQMVYQQLLLGRDKLRKKYIEFSEEKIKLEQEVMKGQSCLEEERSGVPEQERPPTATAAAHLLAVLEDLEQAHKTFEQQEKEQVARGSLHS